MPVANRPILFHHLDALRQAGMLEATIVVEAKSAPAIRSAVGNGEDWGLRGRLRPNARRLPGLDETLAMACDFGGDEPVLIQRVGALLASASSPTSRPSPASGSTSWRCACRVGGRADDDAIEGGWLLSERALSILTQRRGSAADPFTCVRDGGGHVRFQDVDGCLPCNGGEDILLEANRRMLERISSNVDPACLKGSEVEGPVSSIPPARSRTASFAARR